MSLMIWSLFRKRITPTFQRQHRAERPRRRPSLGLELLEDRLVPSTITWVNRGSPGNDSDSFQAIYGANAAAARAIVDTAISAWEQVIVAFHHVDPADDNYQLSVSAQQFDDASLLLGQ